MKIINSIDPITQIVDLIKNLKHEKNAVPIIIAIDGRGGSGKSTLAEKLASLLPKSYALRLDEFYLPQKAIKDHTLLNYDTERVINEFLKPLLARKKIVYGQYNWGFFSNEEDRIITITLDDIPEILIIEGCSASQKALKQYLDLTIFVDIDTKLSYERAKSRDEFNLESDIIEEIWKNWKKAEDEYIYLENPIERANVIISSASQEYEIIKINL
jgi:uridine kinase